MEAKSGGKKVVPKVVKIDKALKTAEIWVKNMSGGTMHQQTENETEGRPAGLGLGARINPHAKPVPSTDPVERRLLGKVNAKRKQNSENEDKINSNDKNEEDSDDETESRTSSFVKKKPMGFNSAASFLAKKRK
ncbi:hypothetical protein LUZ60_012135 [Juncus effusus]|nr:hypothetical protein LUZ60_012135 [Juncus effusus]